ncbi:MAG: hypothetical protein U0353_27055 [Sandaracinus sp.]
MASTSTHLSNVSRLVVGALALSLAGPLAACEAPNQDTLRSMGGPTPDPTGVLRGSILYSGPRPECLRREDGSAYALPGHVVLLLFRYDNPPPPAGSASSAENFLVMPADELFSLDDCMPPEPSAEDLAPIMRSVGFTWPTIRLGRTYQIRGFYDNDGDFNPFFGVRNLATAGDVGGGAFVSASAAVPVYTPIELPPASEAPNGYVVEGVAVTFGAVVRTERPMFQVGEATTALSSEATIPPIADAIAREEALFRLANMRISLVRDPDTSDLFGTNTFGNALAAAGIGFDFRASHHGLPILPVDANSDGVQDLHPILGSSGVPWYLPAILMRRARNPVEVRAGIPDVLLIATIRPTVPLGVRQGFVPRETLASADVVVPPVAVAITNPASPITCRVPYIAPGNIAELYEGRPVDCQELPTGNYDVNVLSGMAGGRVIDALDDCVTECVAGGSTAEACTPGCRTEAALRSDTGYVFTGGAYSSQAWSIPNELGCPDTAYRSTAVNQLDLPRADGTLPSCDESALLLHDQGRQGSFSVVDPDGDNAPDATSTADGHGVASCQNTIRASTGMISAVTYTAPSAECCAPVLPFCGLPLCPLRDASTEGYPEASRGLEASAGTTHQTREMRVPDVDYRVRADGSIEPLCVPFLMPAGCCQMASGT